MVAIYVYTYELQPEEEGDTTDQIYAAMNAAMRDRNAAGIAFWRPLIWEVDSALQRMPAFHGSLYRGIACRFPVNTYVAGQTVCWPSFSSASHNKSVGEKFSEGKEGSLFFLQSLSARSIEALSRYPEEAEVAPSRPLRDVFFRTDFLLRKHEEKVHCPTAGDRCSTANDCRSAGHRCR